MKCSWCYALSCNRPNKELPIDLAKTIIDSLVAINIKKITLIGGEPTLYKYLFDLIKYIKFKSPQTRIGVTTNGIALQNTTYVQNLVSSGLDGCNISLKGLTENEYLQNTGSKINPDLIFTAYRNISAFISNVVLSYVISHDGIEQIKQLYYLCKKNRIRKVLLQFVKPPIQLDAAPIMPMNKMAEMAEFIFNFWPDDIEYKLELSFPVCLIDTNIYERMVNSGHIVSGCHIQTGSGLNYDVDGRIVPCNHFIDLPISDEPSLTPDSIKRIRQSNEYKTVKNTACCFPSQKCKSCKYWNQCRGGCFTRWFYNDPNEII